MEIITEAERPFISRTQGNCTAFMMPGEVPDSCSMHISFAYLIFCGRSLSQFGRCKSRSGNLLSMSFVPLDGATA